MATKSEVRETILKVAGNPVSGAIRDLAEEMAEAIVALDAPAETFAKVTAIKGSSQQRDKETRVLEPPEER